MHPMNIKILQFSLLTLIATIFAIMGVFALLPSSVSAQASSNQSTTVCNKKINKDKCAEEVQACIKAKQSDSCEELAKKYNDVNDLCKSKVRPQACHEGVKQKCDSKKGDEKAKCEKSRADDFKTASSDSEGWGFKAQAEAEVGDRCGNQQSGSSVETSFDFGCLGNAGPDKMGAIEDVVYSIIRFLTAGVGIIVVIVIILSGIQYSASQGNAEATQQAKSRIQNVIIGLFIYLFAFAIIQYLVPGGLFT